MDEYRATSESRTANAELGQHGGSSSAPYLTNGSQRGCAGDCADLRRMEYRWRLSWVLGTLVTI